MNALQVALHNPTNACKIHEFPPSTFSKDSEAASDCAGEGPNSNQAPQNASATLATPCNVETSSTRKPCPSDGYLFCRYLNGNRIKCVFEASTCTLALFMRTAHVVRHQEGCSCTRHPHSVPAIFNVMHFFRIQQGAFAERPALRPSDS